MLKASNRTVGGKGVVRIMNLSVSQAFRLYDQNVLVYAGMKPKTRRNYTTCMNSFIECVGDVPLLVITEETVIVWKTAMYQNGNSNSYIKNNIMLFRKVLEYFRKRGMPVADLRDMELPKVMRRQPTWLEFDEVKLMIEATTNLRDKAIVAMLFSTGCRISELLGLNVEDVEDNDEPIVYGKNDKYRPVYIDRTAREHLDAYLDSRNDRYKPLFMSGQRRRLGLSRVEQIIHETALRAGIEKNITPHTFRHSTITDYIKNGAPMAVVQKIAGHSNIKTTIDIYTHLQRKDERLAFKNYHSGK